MNSMTDAELAALSKEGNLEAFNRLARRWENPLFLFIRRMLGNDEDARDTCQDAFLKAYQNIGRLRDPAKFKAWLHHIALNLCRDFGRSAKVRATQPYEETLPQDERAHPLVGRVETTDLAAERGSLAGLLGSVLGQLPEEQRTAILLREYQGFTARGNRGDHRRTVRDGPDQNLLRPTDPETRARPTGHSGCISREARAMNETPLDPQREKMIAALYGELPPDEMEAFLAALEENEELKLEWNELQGTRAFLQQADQESAAPQFQFLMPLEEKSEARPFWPRLRRLFLTPAAGFATVALALLVLIGAGLRVDSRDGALMLHFGELQYQNGASDLADGSANTTARPALSQGVPLEPPSGAADATGGAIQRVSGTSDVDSYVTRGDLTIFAEQFMRMMDERMRSSRQQQRGEFVYLLNEITESVSEQQRINNARRDAQLEDVWLGVVGMVAARGNTSRSQPGINPSDVSVTPVQQTTPNREESGTND